MCVCVLRSSFGFTFADLNGKKNSYSVGSIVCVTLYIGSKQVKFSFFGLFFLLLLLLLLPLPLLICIHTHTHTHPRSTNQLPRDRVGIIRTPCKYNPKRNKKKPTNKNGCAIFFCNNKSKTNILDADSNTMSDHRVFFGFFCFSFPFFLNHDQPFIFRWWPVWRSIIYK